MKFVMLPTFDPPATYIERGDGSKFLALPMPGERIADLATNEIDGTIYPVTMTTEQLCKWWHRVRQWEVVANHPLWSGDRECNLVLDESSVYSTDEEIVDDKETATSWYYAGSWTGNFVWNDGAFDRTAYFTLRILRKPSVDIDKSYYLTENFAQILPYLRLEFNTTGIDGNEARADSAAFYDGTAIVQGTCSADIEGITPSMTAAFDTGSGFEDDPMTLTLTPSLYWEYRDVDGQNPKYDSLTGAIL